MSSRWERECSLSSWLCEGHVKLAEGALPKFHLDTMTIKRRKGQIHNPVKARDIITSQIQSIKGIKNTFRRKYHGKNENSIY